MPLKFTMPILPALRWVVSKLRPPRFVPSSADYWERRYRGGGTSGAGSYNRLAEFKAEFLNSFVETHGIDSVVEFGSGDGAQVGLASYPDYYGIDVSRSALAHCKNVFASQSNRTFLHTSEVPADLRGSLTLSLDVVYHLVEDDVFERYMRDLFDTTTDWVIVYSSNEERGEAEHVRHRKFTRWVEQNRLEFSLIETVLNRYPFDPADPNNTSFADFYVYRKR